MLIQTQTPLLMETFSNAGIMAQRIFTQMSTVVYSQVHILSPSHTGITTRLRPTCDRKILESWANRRKNVPLVAEVGGDRQGKISRSKVVVMFKTPKVPVTPGLRPGYDLAGTEKYWNRGQIVERTYDWYDIG